MKKIIKSLLAIILSLSLIVIVVPPPATANTTLDGRVIILDPGHGINMNMYKGYDEGETMLAFSKILKTKLENQGATVYVTRTTDADVSLTERASFTNKISLELLKDIKNKEMLSADSARKSELSQDIKELDRLISIMDDIIGNPNLASTYYRIPYTNSENRVIHPDLKKVFEFQNDPLIESRMLFLSLHTNATPLPIDETQNGVTAYFVTNDLSYNKTYYNNYSYIDNNKFLGELIIDGVSTLGMAKLKTETNNFVVTRETNVPAILMENGFHTNDKDRALLQKTTFLNDMADQYVKAITTYYSSSLVPELVEYGKTTIGNFKDVFEGEWYDEYLKFVIENEMINGESDTKFDTEAQVTKAMLVTAIAKIDQYIQREITEAITVEKVQESLVEQQKIEEEFIIDDKIKEFLGEYNQILQGNFEATSQISKQKDITSAKIDEFLVKQEESKIQALNKKIASYTDVSLVDWYYDGFEFAIENNLLDNVVSGTTFGANDVLTKEEISQIIYNYMKIWYDTNEINEICSNAVTFGDYWSINGNYRVGSVFLNEIDVFNKNQYNYFYPSTKISKIELCEIVYNICEILVG